MAVDPRTPVIVGAGQVTHRDESDEPTSLGLMVEAARRAAKDSGRAGLLERAQSVAAVEVISWPVPDPARAVAAQLGIGPEETVRTVRGGNGPAELLADLCGRIAAGDLDVALMVGGEAFNPFMRATREGRATGWPEQPEGTEPTRMVGEDHPPSHAAEIAAGLIAPISYYPMFETALRGAAGHDPEAHRRRVAALWGRFAEVAHENPYAWTTDPPPAEAIATPSAGNRMVAYPYPKLMTANIQVDQGAALLLCSAEAAAAAGVTRDRWVFVHATASAHDHWFAGERDVLHRSPAIGACARSIVERSGVGIDDVGHVDLYSCFPSAVQIAAEELGLDLDRDSRPPTVTGGLTFAGGPANNYVTHSLAALAERVRADGGHALASAVGWYLTKHGLVLLGADPPPTGFSHSNPQAEVDRLPGRELAQRASGEASVEACTAIYDRDGSPTLAIVSILLADGRRALARSEDPATIGGLLADEPLALTAALDGEGGFSLGAATR